MTFKKCGFCGNRVPAGGQCNKCGYVDGLSRQPSDEEFRHARETNKKNGYKQFENIDMLLLDE
jgi:hypothetical protein